MRREEDWFGERELDLVHVSGRLREALAVEALLTDAGVDYLVGAGKYRTRFLFAFPVERVGAYFFVPVADAERSRRLLEKHRHQVIEADDGG